MNSTNFSNNPLTNDNVHNISEFNIKPSGIVELLAEADIFTQKTISSNINVYDYSGPIPFLRLGLYEFTYDLGGYISEIYMRFNLPTIENIGSMVLQLSYWDGYPIEADEDYEVNASLVSNNWVETTTTWTERPEYLGPSTLIYLNNPGLESEILIDLTSLVEGLSDTTITIHLCPNNLSRIRFPAPFKSTESHGITPKLILEMLPDTSAPTYSDLIESADPLQLGQNETISIKVYDPPGSEVNQTLLEYDFSNHSMTFLGGNTWSWNNWKPSSTGIYPYKIHMQDMENNWNMTSETITVVNVTAPIIVNLTESGDPLELGNNITIAVDVFDNETVVGVVLIELDGVNHTMTNVGGFTYEFSWTKLSVGIIYYTIYTNDTENYWNSFTSSFDIVDTTLPAFSDLVKSEDPLEFGSTVIISVNSTDLSDINQIIIEFEDSNHSMTKIGGNAWQYDLWIPSATGNCSYTIWAEDNNNNWASIN
ncbi:MAG: DNRLRE domain-containing protein, partial [Promethearchaeota archaeon]